MKPATRLVRSLACGAVLAVGSASYAATVRLDDSGTYPLQPSAQMQWQSAIPKRPGSAATEAQMRVQVRIDTRPYVGKQGRIYMVLAQDDGPPLSVEWVSQGTLLPGHLVSGQRTLVFTGVVTTPLLEDQLGLRISSGADWPVSQRRLSFHFELDTE